jgi:hypothetical protein
MPEQVVPLDGVEAFETRPARGTGASCCSSATAAGTTTFKEEIARQAVAAEGKNARSVFHEQVRSGFRNVYLDRVEMLDDERALGDGDGAKAVAWKTAVEAAPRLVGDAPADGIPADELFDKLFKQRVVDDIRDDED